MASRPRITSFASLAVLLPESYTPRKPKTVTTESSTPSTIARRRTPRPASTPLTGTVVIGTVLMVIEERGFGFAQAIVDGAVQKIFFHVNRGREVIGTADEPQLTSAFKEHSVIAKPPRPSEIVMIIDANDKGFYATAWGIRPKRDWRADAIKFDDGFQRFTGGFVCVHANGDPNAATRYEGTLAEIHMSLDELNIVITDGKKHEPNSHFGTACDTVILCYKLDKSYLDAKTERSADHYTRKVIIVTDPVTGQQQRITIQMPRRFTSND